LKKAMDLLAADSEADSEEDDEEDDEEVEGWNGKGRASARWLLVRYLMLDSSCIISL
jgi:hypothetical protein